MHNRVRRLEEKKYKLESTFSIPAHGQKEKSGLFKIKLIQIRIRQTNSNPDPDLDPLALIKILNDENIFYDLLSDILME